MPKCPQCGELARRGQNRCFACGHRLDGRTPKIRRPRATNPLVFVAAGLAVLVAIAAIILTIPRQKRSQQVQKEQAELGRVRDSVRQANKAVKQVSAGDALTRRLADELDKLEQRFERTVDQSVGEKPGPEQEKLVREIKAKFGRMKTMAASIALVTEPERSQRADSVRAGERHIRTLISQLARAPKGR